MNRNTIVIIFAVIAVIVFGGYLYEQNQKIDELQQALVSGQSTPKLQQTANGYTETPRGKNYNHSAGTVKKANVELEARKKEYRDHWVDFVTVTRSEFLTREIGGIFDLKVIVENKFDAPIDKLVALVHYIKSDGEVHKTKEVIFENIAANSRVELPAAESSRGKDVKIEIAAVNVRAYNFCYPGNNRIENDPYLCEF